MPPQKFVIDACVGCASGSKVCRDFLKQVYRNKYDVAMSITLWDEWKRHESDFAKSWRKSMREKRRLHRLDIRPNDDVRDRIRTLPDVQRDSNIYVIIMDDIHLVETALETDKIIISLDEQARGHFRNASRSIDELKVIIWVNPKNQDERVFYWLDYGARPDDFRKLGYVDPEKNKLRSGHLPKRYVKGIS